VPLPLADDVPGIEGPPFRSPLPEVEATSVPETRYRIGRRFDRANRLLGDGGIRRLLDARVLVFGGGGGASFTAEALARSGVGRLVLVDFDQVCITNTNRQLHAMRGTVGKKKVEVMAERLRRVHPTATIEPIPAFYSEARADELLAGSVDFVVDAIDNLTAKAHLIATCLRRGLPLVSSMGAAARLDPTRIRVADLADTEVDPLARSLRKLLRQHHGVVARKGAPVGISAVYSLEPPLPPLVPHYDEGVGFRCVCPSGKNGLHECDRRNRIDGSAAFVTGAFGLAAASVVVRSLVGDRSRAPAPIASSSPNPEPTAGDAPPGAGAGR